MTLKFKDKLNGKRISLQRNTPTDNLAETMFETIDSNREHLRPWLPWEKLTLKVEDSMKYLVDTEEKTQKGERVDYGIYLENQYVGNIGFMDISKTNKSGEIGYWMSSEVAGNGYMTEAVGILERELFDSFDFNRILIKCDERNVASARVAKKCGYTHEGTLREDTWSDHFEDFRNTLIFSKLKSEYSHNS